MEKRRQDERQRDLKATHFDHGKYQLNIGETMAKTQFQGYPESKPRCYSTECTDNKKSNFQLGTYKPDDFYTSAANKHFQAPQNPDSGQISHNQKDELRKHHFSYGGDRPMYVTTNDELHDQKGKVNENMVQRQERKDKFMGQHFDIGYINKKRYCTAYEQQFDISKEHALDSHREKLNLKDRMNKIRQTNFTLGGDPVSRVSEQKGEMLQKERDSITCQAGLKKLNLKT